MHAQRLFCLNKVLLPLVFFVSGIHSLSFNQALQLACFFVGGAVLWNILVVLCWNCGIHPHFFSCSGCLILIKVSASARPNSPLFQRCGCPNFIKLSACLVLFSPMLYPCPCPHCLKATSISFRKVYIIFFSFFFFFFLGGGGVGFYEKTKKTLENPLKNMKKP